MKPIHLKVARVGNSRGVRLPAPTLERYRIGDRVIMEERADGILLRPIRSAGPKLTWEETARAMASEGEDWSDWDDTGADGLDQVPWEAQPVKRVAARTAPYAGAARKSKQARQPKQRKP